MSKKLKKIDLREVRLEKGLTIEQVAMRAELSQSSVRQLELGIGAGFSPLTKHKLCAALGIPLSEAFPADYQEVADIVAANEETAQRRTKKE